MKDIKSNANYDLIISIKPRYVEKIIEGTKIFEFRKSIMKRPVKNIYIYETQPTKQIIGYFEYSGYMSGTPEEIWLTCYKGAGIGERDFLGYYKGTRIAYALNIKNFRVIGPINPKEVLDKFTPPQSFMYIPEGCLVWALSQCGVKKGRISQGI